MRTIFPFSRPLYMMAKPVGATCNLACRYCYYIDKQQMYDGKAERMMMSDDTLECFVRQYLESQPNPEVLFTWHGGEPLLLPKTFYEKAIALQHRYAEGRHVDNCLQTNGTLLTDDWCSFFHDNGWLIGISIDGPEHLHDAFRKTRQGHPSWRQVMDGIERLEKHGVMWNALATVNSQNVAYPTEVYHFFKSIGCKYIQFTPVGGTPIPNSEQGEVEALAFGRFLCGVFDEWVKEDVGEYYINIFEATLANYFNITPGMCAMSELCGHVGVVEWNGDVYSCDHFVSSRHYLGNLHQQTIYQLMYSPQQQIFAHQKSGTLPRQCKACKWLFTCHGECPRNRTTTTTDGEPGLNYLCEGYQMYFAHVDTFMRQMVAEQTY